MSKRRKKKVRGPTLCEGENDRNQRRTSVRVKLSAHVSSSDVEAGHVSSSLDLDVHVGLDEMGRGDGSVRDESSVVSRLGAPGDNLGLLVTDRRSLVGRSEQAEVVDRVERRQSGVGRLVVGSEGGGRRVGGTVGS